MRNESVASYLTLPKMTHVQDPLLFLIVRTHDAVKKAGLVEGYSLDWSPAQ